MQSFTIPLDTVLFAALAAVGCSRSSTGDEPTAASSATVVAEPPRAPTVLVKREEVVREALWVDVYAHGCKGEKGSFLCWTYVSDGLWALHQKEIVLTVKREPGEKDAAYYRDLLGFYSAVHSLASQGKLVDTQGHTRLGPKTTVLGRDDLRCVVYAPPADLPPGLVVRAPRITALFVPCGELDLADRAGHTRLLARLGSAASYFPFPPWIDRHRAPVAPLAGDEESMVPKLDPIHLRGAVVRMERKGGLAVATGKDGFFVAGDRVRLEVYADAAAELKRAVEAERTATGLMLLLEPDPQADACLVYLGKPKKRDAITLPNAKGERLTANFLVLKGGAEKNEANTLEDGFVLSLTDETWNLVRTEIGKGGQFTLEGSGSMPALDIRWSSLPLGQPP